MKSLNLSLFALSALSAASASPALANQSAQLVLDASAPVQSIQATDQQYEPIYGVESYQTTCSQQVFDHNDTNCVTVFDNQCRPGPMVCDSFPGGGGPRPGGSGPGGSGGSCRQGPPMCQQIPRQSCSTQPVYRTDYYTCTQQRTVVTGQRLVKTYNHSIEVRVDDASLLANQELDLNLSIVNNNVSMTMSNSDKNALLTSSLQVIANSDSGSQQDLHEVLLVKKVADASALNAFARAQNLQVALGSNGIKIAIPGAAPLTNMMSVYLKLRKHHALWAPTTVVETTVDASKQTLSNSANDLNAMIQFSSLNVGALGNENYSLDIHASLNVSNLLNASDFQNALNKQVSDSIDKQKVSF